MTLADLEERVLRVEEAARLLGISPSTYYGAAARGEVPVVRIGRRLVVPGAQLRRLLEGRGPMSPPEKVEGSAANRAPETSTNDSPGSYPNLGTLEEQEVLGRLLELFPGSTVGQPEATPRQSLLAEADEVLGEPEGFELVPLDFAKLLAEGIPEPDFLHVYVVRGSRIWGFGPAESAKTLFFQWLTAKLTREGRTVVFISAENPLATDLDRMSRLRPDWSRLRYFHMPPLDLADPTHLLELLRVSYGADLVVIDTLSATYSGTRTPTPTSSSLTGKCWSR